MIGIFGQQIVENQIHEYLPNTPKFPSLSIVMVERSHECISRRQENDLSASALPIGSPTKIQSSSRTLGKKIGSASWQSSSVIRLSPKYHYNELSTWRAHSQSCLLQVTDVSIFFDISITLVGYDEKQQAKSTPKTLIR